MFIGHDENRCIVPRRGKLFVPGEAGCPSALRAMRFKNLHPVTNLGQIMHLDRTGASGRGTMDRFMLQRMDELLMHGSLL